MNKDYYFFRIPHDLHENGEFNKARLSEKWLFVCLCKLANKFENEEGWFFHSMSELEKVSGMSEHTVRKAKKALIQMGLIEVKSGCYKNSNMRCADSYRIIGYKMR